LTSDVSQISRPHLDHATVRDSVRRALAEDAVGDDITTRWSVPGSARTSAVIIAREDGVVAGLPVLQEVYAQVDQTVQVTLRVEDGAAVGAGTVLAELNGLACAIITGERVALNFLQRMSGIATGAAAYAAAVQGLPVRILDTRKTAPGLRALDKYAVTAGGLSNHRMDLSAMVLLKENHIAAAGGVRPAIERVRAAMLAEARDVLVDVEVRTVAEAATALEAGASWIMLDNMSLGDMRAVVELRRAMGDRESVKLEASGNVNLATVRSVAETGVDLISVGALTHSVRALDLSLLLEPVSSR
jgi:nicotinate-nucleotide pyrophosphorylase (carboxylating)